MELYGPGLCALAAFSIWFTSATATRLLRIKSPSAALVSWGVLAHFQMVAAAWVLSWPRALTREVLVILHVCVASMVAMFWLRSGRPSLIPNLSISLKRLRIMAMKRWALGLLGLAVALSALTCIFLILYVPANNWDSMTTHLARAAFWMQNRSIGYFASHNPLHNDYPRGASIAQMYAMIFLRRDLLEGFVQFFAWMGCIVSIYDIGRRLGYRPSACVQAALLCALLPQFLLQATSTQIDLIFAFTAAASMYFLLLAAARGRFGFTAVAAIAAGLVFATKGSAPLLIPVFAAVFISCVFFLARRKIRFALSYGAGSVLAIAILGSESYVSNYLRYGSLATPGSVTPRSLRVDPLQVRANIIRCAVAAYEPFFDTPYDQRSDWRRVTLIRKLAQLLQTEVEDTSDFRAQPLAYQLFRTIQEDLSWYGFVGFVLFPLCNALAVVAVPLRAGFAARRWIVLLVYHAGILSAATISLTLAALCFVVSAALILLWGDRSRPQAALRWFLAAGITAHVLFGMAVYMWITSIARYLLPAAAMGAPLMARVFQSRRRRTRVIAGVLSVFAVIQAVDVFLHNERKPLVPAPTSLRFQSELASIFGLSREQRRALSNWRMVEFARQVGKIDPPVRRIGYVSLDAGSWDFPVFGETFERELLIIDHRSDWRAEMDRLKLDYVAFVSVHAEDRRGYRTVWTGWDPEITILERERGAPAGK